MGFNKVFSAVDKKVEEYIQSSPVFFVTCKEIYESIDEDDTKRITFDEAADAMDDVYDKMKGDMDKFGIPVSKLNKDELLKLCEEVDYDKSRFLDFEEFRNFYTKVLKVMGFKASSGVVKTYGPGVVAGCVAVWGVKKLLTNVPIAKHGFKPLMSLAPTVVFGPLLGAAAVYGIRKGDLLAAAKASLGKK